MRIMAIDLGDARTGVSVSDPGGTLAGYSVSLPERKRDALIGQLKAIAEEYGVGRVVLGLPLNMNGSPGPMAEKVKAFGDRLGAVLGREIVYWDERGTTRIANRALSDAGIKRGRQRAKVDAVAAAVILQSYLEFIRGKE
jgi:putative Holliday junction resolvase